MNLCLENILKRRNSLFLCIKMFLFTILIVERGKKMKSTGIVRRIDELGRVVIPKEIRKTLKIREGDTLEIYVEKDFIILKKFSHLNNLSSTAKKMVSIVSNTLKKNIIIVDLDHVLACSKNLEDDYLDKPISSQLVNLLMNRKNEKQFSIEPISFIDTVEERCSYVMSPILVDSDVLGAIILFDENPLEESDSLISQMLSTFFIKTVEE